MLSVIIATRDRAALLESTLDALTAQQSPGQPFEILVADNASVDHTAEAVSHAATRAPVPIIYLREERPGKSQALNSALKRARGDVLVFTDDDVVPSPGWLAAYARTFAESDADFAVGRILPLWQAPCPDWMSPALYCVLAISDGGSEPLPLGRGLNDHIMPLGANMAVRRRVVDQIGGWDPSLGKLQGTLRSGEDHEFALRMIGAGFTGVYKPEAFVQHRVPAERLRHAYFRRWFYENGTIVAGLERSYPSTNRYLLNVPRYLWRRALTDAWTAAGALVTGDARRAVAGAMRLTWFGGYVRGRWS